MLQQIKEFMDKHSQDSFNATNTGQFTLQLDRALLGKHVKYIYDSLSQEDAAILCQLHTGKCRLNSYLKTINAVDTNLCEACNQVKSATYFLFNCHRWNTERCKLFVATHPIRQKDLSYFLGGWSG